MTSSAIGQMPTFPARTWSNRFSISSCSLRAARFEDLPFLRQLYRSFRKEEFANIPWPQESKDAFLDQQFDLQHRYYIAAFPGTDFLIMEKDGAPIGRLYLQMAAIEWHIIDIGFLSQWRNHGLGSAILNSIRNAAITEQITGIVLHVDRTNTRAQKLYQASGFQEVETSVTHIRMQWLLQGNPCEAASEPSHIN